jgi:hypothetical protein
MDIFLESQVVLTAYYAFAMMVHTQYDTSIHVFHADFAGEYLCF